MPDLVLPPSLAVWDPLGGTPEPLMGGHNGIVVHTMAGTFAGTDSYFHQNGWSGTESTVGIAGSGFCKQWVPWNRQADANLEGNWDRLSIECADYGESFPPSSTAGDESPPLTDAQVACIIDLCVYWCRPESHAACPSSWRCNQHGIPARWIATSCEHGIGVHRHGIDPWRNPNCPRWSAASGKICPRHIRLRQVRDDVVPEVARRLDPIPPPPKPASEEDAMYLVQFDDSDKWFACGWWGRFHLSQGFPQIWVEAHLQGGGRAHFNGSPDNPQPLLWHSSLKNIYPPVRVDIDD